MNLVNYRLAPASGKLPEPEGLYEYCLAANGVFVRAKRAGLYACIQVGVMLQSDVRGLGELTTEVRLERAPVGHELLMRILERASDLSPVEGLWWLRPGLQAGWIAYEPKQMRSVSSVRPLDPFDPWGAEALIDIHSHHNMRAFFSAQDDRDEAGGFRIFAVLGHVNDVPKLAVRVGVYGHFQYLEAERVFNLGGRVVDVCAYKSSDFELSEEDLDDYMLRA